MQNLPIALDFSDGVDRKVLKLLVGRFMEVNAGRLKRARSALTWRQQRVLDLLPLIFHLNHPSLPGYLTTSCPAGLLAYEPEKEALAAALRYARSFQLPRSAIRKRDLTGIFLMGSPGSLGQSVASDLDVWLCYRDDLAPGAVAGLRRKADEVTRWAEGFGLELNIYVFSAEAFRNGCYAAEVSKDNSGSAQHCLLLDEFYRTAIHLGGGVPLWWLIPPDQEPDYRALADTLIRNRFVRAHDYLDFGPVAEIPREEFLGAGVWHLYKGIDSPWKSLLKLLLIECYAELPSRGPLSADFKWAIYRGRLELDALDPYVMLYRRLERWLLETSGESRLELVRQALYLKAGLPLTRAEDVAGRWQGQLLSGLVEEWGWSRDRLTQLDGRHRWRCEEVMALRRVLVAELTNSFRLLSRLARESALPASIRPADLNLLGRKLYAAFQRKAGKIERINPGIALSLAEENLAFCLDEPDSSAPWFLYRDLGSSPERAAAGALRRGGNLVELLLWCHCNGLLTRVTRLNLRAPGAPLLLADLQAMAAVVARALPDPGVVSRDTLARPRFPLTLLLLVNVGVDPLAHLTDRGLHKLSGQNDSLGFSGARDNLVARVDLVTRNSWHEVSLQSYLSGDVLLQGVAAVLEAVRSQPAQLPELHVWCAGRSHALPIARRVEQLLSDLLARFFAGGAGPHSLRYVFELDSRFGVVQFERGQAGVTTLPDTSALMEYLARPRGGFCPVVFDRHAMAADPVMKRVCEASQPGLVQVFFQVRGRQVRLWVVDELGSVSAWQQPAAGSRAQLLAPLLLFLDNLQQHRALRQGGGGQESVHDIRCAEVVLDQGEVRLIARDPAPRPGWRPSIVVRAVGVQTPAGDLDFDLYCDDQYFPAGEVDRYCQMKAVATCIRHRRSGAGRYPVYLTDLELPQNLDGEPWLRDPQTSQYVWHRQRLQQDLNQALERL